MARVIGLVNTAYLVCGLTTTVAALTNTSAKRRHWWYALSAATCVLELLRLGDASLWAGRYLEEALQVLGWYERRRILQVAAISIFAIVCLAILRRMRVGSRPWALRTAISGFYALALLAAIRFSSLHWTDLILQRPVGMLSVSYAAQIILLMVISGAALLDVALGTHEQEPVSDLCS